MGKRLEQGQIKRLLENARGHGLAAKVLMSSVFKEQDCMRNVLDEPHEKDFNLISSAGYTNYSLSLELSLKALIAIRSGNHPRTHRLDLLFDELGNEDKEALRKVYWARGVVSMDRSIDGHFERMKDSFVNVRYSHEGEGGLMVFYGDLAINVCAYVESKVPHDRMDEDGAAAPHEGS